MEKTKKGFTKGEWGLWLGSVGALAISQLLLGAWEPATLGVSVLGVTSLIFCARGNPVGQGLMILFGCLYGAISYTFAYYGEMMTYLGMTVPMAILSLVSWLRHPYRGRRTQVAVNTVHRGEVAGMLVLALGVTAAFYYLLKALGTANLVPSTLSVTTSFAAAYLTLRRSEYFALAYALNDLVLILLWVLAAREQDGYWAVAVCFGVFFINDLYGFVCWRRRRLAQGAPEEKNLTGQA